MMQRRTSNSTKDLITVVLLIFLFPVGLSLMWYWGNWKTWIKISITALLILPPTLIILIYTFVLRPYTVNGISMDPNYAHNEQLAVSVYHNFPIARGTVVIYKNPQGETHIGRVIGLPKERVSIQNNSVFINGKELQEKTYLPGGEITELGNFPSKGATIIIPKDSYYVLGDNRRNSIDSRHFGSIPANEIIATGGFCYWNCVQYDNEVVDLNHHNH